ncbi:hypothetical protein J2T13_003441 [Paenibacillus sp. DS2015]
MFKNRIISALLAFILLGTLVFPAVSSAAATQKSIEEVNTISLEKNNPVVTINTAGENDFNSEDYYSDYDDTFTDEDEEEYEYDPEFAEFLDYADQLELIASFENKAISSFEKYAYVNITSSNRKQAFITLNNSVVPNYTKFVVALKKIKPTNTTLKNIHATYIKGASLQLQGLTLMKNSLSTTKINSKLFYQANSKLDTGRTLVSKYSNDIDSYVAKFEY